MSVTHVPTKETILGVPMGFSFLRIIPPGVVSVSIRGAGDTMMLPSLARISRIPPGRVGMRSSEVRNQPEIH